LSHVHQTTGALGPVLGLAQDRQQNPRQDGTHCDDHQQFNQRKRLAASGTPDSFSLHFYALIISKLQNYQEKSKSQAVKIVGRKDLPAKGVKP
jgi:hypothetical protein